MLIMGKELHLLLRWKAFMSGHYLHFVWPKSSKHSGDSDWVNEAGVNGAIRGCMQSQIHKRLTVPAPLSMKQCYFENKFRQKTRYQCLVKVLWLLIRKKSLSGKNWKKLYLQFQVPCC